MSCFPLKKQLLPSKKAWRSFTSILQSKLQRLKRSKPIKQATTHLNSVLRRPARSSYRLRHKKKVGDKKLHQHRSFAPVYVDELFQSHPEPLVANHVEQPVEEKKAVEKSVTAARISATAAGSSSSSHAPPLPFETSYSVDTRAEIFIAKFRESMRLESQRSVQEYYEMLARGL